MPTRPLPRFPRQHPGFWLDHWSRPHGTLGRMMGSSKRAAATEAVRSAVKSAGGLVLAALAVSAVALVVAVVALVMVARRPAL